MAIKFDTDPLNWVKPEIDQSLVQAKAALDQFKADKDLTQIRFCRTHVHQVHGALFILGLDGITSICESTEALLSAIEEKRLAADVLHIGLVERALNGVSIYLDELMAGQPNQPLRLFDIHKALLQARGLNNANPTDLFFPDLTVRPPKRDIPGRALSIAQIKRARSNYERALLTFLKNPAASETSRQEMQEAVAPIEGAQSTLSARAFWWVALAFLDAIADTNFAKEPASKKICSRINIQIRHLVEGSTTTSDYLMREMLFYIATIKATPGSQIAEVQDAYGLLELIPLEQQKMDPLDESNLRRLRETLASTEDHWNKFCIGTQSSLALFVKDCQQVATLSKDIAKSDMGRLGQALCDAAKWLEKSPTSFNDTVSMEIATAILLLQSAQENYRHLGADFGQQVDRILRRLEGCIRGESVSDGDDDLPVLDEITRRAQEKRLLNQVGREIQSNLAKIEQALDTFFRDPTHHQDLISLGDLFKQISGALIILGHSDAAVLLEQSKLRVIAFSEEGYQPQITDFEEVASNLSMIGFFIDAIAQGENDFSHFVKRLNGEADVNIDDKLELLPAIEAPVIQHIHPPTIVIAQPPRTSQEATPPSSEVAAVEPLTPVADTPATETLAPDETIPLSADVAQDALPQEAVVAADENITTAAEQGDVTDPLVAENSSIVPIAWHDTDALETHDNVLQAPKPEMVETRPEIRQLAQSTLDDIDADLLEIFIEEAREVLEELHRQASTLKRTPNDVEALTTIRRCTHTLKGSGRMVGLTDLGNVAWDLEQSYNYWLRYEKTAKPVLLQLIEMQYAVFVPWVDYLEKQCPTPPDTEELLLLSAKVRGDESHSAPPGLVTSLAIPEPTAVPLAKADSTTVSEVPAEETPALSANITDEAVGSGEHPESPHFEDIDFDLPNAAEFESPATEKSAKEVNLSTETMGVLNPDSPVDDTQPGVVPHTSDFDTTATAGIEDFSLAKTTLNPVFANQPFAGEMPDSSENLSQTDETEDFSLAKTTLNPVFANQPFADEMPDSSENLSQTDNIETPSLAEGGAAVDQPLTEETPASFPDLQDADQSTTQPIGDVPDIQHVEAHLPEAMLGAESTDTVDEISKDDVLADLPQLTKVEEIAAVAPEEKPISIFDIFREEAAQHFATLDEHLSQIEANPTELAHFDMTRAAHTLAGTAGTIGQMAIRHLGLALERALLRRNHAPHPEEAQGLGIIHEAIEQLHTLFEILTEDTVLKEETRLIAALDASYPAILELHPEADLPVDSTLSLEFDQSLPENSPLTLEETTENIPVLQVGDEIDEQLLPIFLEEAVDQLLELEQQVRIWRADPASISAPQILSRVLHTFKGNARMAGAMRLGELAHLLESRVSEMRKNETLFSRFIDELESRSDTLAFAVEQIKESSSADISLDTEALTLPLVDTPLSTDETLAVLETPQAADSPASPLATTAKSSHDAPHADTDATLRVRASLIDRLVNEAGELSIARTRIEGEMRGLKSGFLELTESIIRLRRQLREIEIQAEAQMQTRVAQTAAMETSFDPLELDRFSRFQEITRFMVESVNDVATAQQSLLKNLDATNAALLAQSRLNRGLQHALMSVRMLPFSSQTERLYRIVRQTAKSLGKRATLDIVNSHIEIDRSVIDKMMGPLEHMLRNAVSHGIENKEERKAAGKAENGEITLKLAQESNEIILSLSDDGRGMNAEGIRAKAESLGLLTPGTPLEPARLYDYIFHPGFSTATEVTQISGRGVGMDVVKTEVGTLGGRIEIQSEQGKGTTFRLYLPLTLAVAQTVLVRTGSDFYAIPSTMIEQVMEVKIDQLSDIQQTGRLEWKKTAYNYHFLPHLLGNPAAKPEVRRFYWLLLLRSGTQRVALQVDELQSSREVVIKNAGEQLARVVGIAGATVLGDGRVVLILNPVALANRPVFSRTTTENQGIDLNLPATVVSEDEDSPKKKAEDAALNFLLTLPTVMIVDDSLTVRKVTSRLLERQGYQVLVAKDGVEALEKLIEIRPHLILSDVEMPRMDGFDLLRNIRSDSELKEIPVIMITSRMAKKHRDHAVALGANHYLGKPFDEDELLSLVASYTGKD